MAAPFADLSPALVAAAFFLLGVVIGSVINLWAIRLVVAGIESLQQEPFETKLEPPELLASQLHLLPNAQPSPWYHFLPIAGYWLANGRGSYRGLAIGYSPLIAELGTGALFAGYALAYLLLDCQRIAEVQPDDFWRSARIAYHLVLITLLAAATATDLRDYVIPDSITIPGTVIGIAAAAISGQLQMIHVWVDWNQEIPGLRGPYLPDWLDAHRHLHGLAWSLAGAVAGGGITQITRLLSRRILGREAMGLGDVTLMAMIGSYLGWQPVVLVFFLAPICGLLVAPAAYALTGRAFLAYGPYLSAAAFGVLCTWKWLWLPVRKIFGDAQLLTIVGAGSLAVFVALLGAIRWYQSRRLRPSGN